MSDPSGRKSRSDIKWEVDGVAPPVPDTSEADEPEAQVKKTESLVRTLIVEERRRVTSRLFPELEPQDPAETREPAKSLRDRVARVPTLNQSVREILQAERQPRTGASDARSGILARTWTRALGALRSARPGARQDADTKRPDRH